MMRLFPHLMPLLALSLLLAGCAGPRTGPEAAVPAVPVWRSIATDADRQRIRKWRTSWTQALSKAQAAGHGAEIAREGALLDPDAALAIEAPPPGDYRCRTIKLGAQSQGMLDYVVYPAFACRVGAPDTADVQSFVKLSGSQRPVGRMFPESQRRLIFLGSLQLGDEQGVLRYGRDRQRDLAGIVERIGEGRWRIAFPQPAFESTLDVLELIPSA